jgi:OOP family OmpA-OmpF porin
MLTELRSPELGRAGLDQEKEMQLIRIAVQSIFLAAVLGIFASAQAQEGFYGGVGVGVVRTPIGSDALAITGATASSLSRKDDDTGGKIFAGYRLRPELAVEVGYVDLGKTNATRSMTTPVGGIALDSRNTGFFVDLVGTIPIGTTDFSVIGKLGGVASETTRQLSPSGAVALAPGSALTSTEREANWKYGAGAQYEISKTMSARGEWERYHKLGKDAGTGESEANLFSVNLLFKFH